MRQLIAMAITAILLGLASGSVNAQVKCTECYVVWLPVVHVSNVEGQGVQR